MIPAAKFLFIGILFVAVSSYRVDDQFVTFNTSATQSSVSVSIASNIASPFTVYSPILFDTPVTFSPNPTESQFSINPVFAQDAQRLYNEKNAGEYWYAFKKLFNPEKIDITASFALTKIAVGDTTSNYVLPLFSLPLSSLNLANLYKCDDVLISYQNTNSVVDVTVFSQKESWHLFPEALWGFRQKDQQINFSRQTFPVGTEIEIDVGPNKFCVLNDKLPINTYNLVEQKLYSLSDLFLKYSTSLTLQNKVTEEEL